MLFPPTLGFRMEQYFLSMQNLVHLGKSGYAWVANTLGSTKAIKMVAVTRPG